MTNCHQIDNKLTTKCQDLEWAMGLIGFGIVFNKVTSWVEEQFPELFTSVLVVIGVSVTLIMSMREAGKEATKKLFFAFAMTGLPMIAGSLGRWEQRAKAGKEALNK